MGPSERDLPQSVRTLDPEAVPGPVREAVERTLELKASDVVVLDLRALSSATDFFILATGTSDIQVRAIADHVIDELKKSGVRPDHVEGMNGGRWILIDYFDLVVHVFHSASREFYRLDLLWGDAPRWLAEE